MEYNITYRKKDKGWQYIITVKKDGKWKHAGSKQGFTTKALSKVAAEKRVDEMKENFELQEKLAPEHQDLTFMKFADMYEKHKTLHDAVNTVRTFTNAAAHFSALNDMEVASIMPYHIQECIDDMTKKGLTPSSIKLYTVTIKTFFNFAISPYRIIADNPVKDMRMPKIQKEKDKIGEVRALNKKELEGLLCNIVPPKYYIASLLAAKCGLRVGEIVGLTWDRVDTKKAEIVINRQWKELEKNVWGFGAVKTENSNRIIPAPPVVIAELEKFKNKYPRHISGRILPYSSSNGFGSILLNYYPTLGYDISAHDLRHTYATTLIGNGLDFKTVAELMGHDVEQTIKTYSHVTSDMMANAKNLINKIL